MADVEYGSYRKLYISLSSRKLYFSPCVAQGGGCGFVCVFVTQYFHQSAIADVQCVHTGLLCAVEINLLLLDTMLLPPPSPPLSYLIASASK